jgi:aminomethyltransferase
MAQKTVLNDIHREAGGRMVEFAGWELPLHFGSQVAEHHAVRRDAGMFDVSHMAILDLEGREVRPFLRRLLANDIGRLKSPGQALYSCLLNEAGGIIDDLMVFRRAGERFRIISNAATRDRVSGWIGRQAEPYAVVLKPRSDLALIAVQGPAARCEAVSALPPELREAAGGLGFFEFAESGEWFVSCSGYTGEDGYELILPRDAAAAVWRQLATAGVRPCGLGARDTLRLEAGLRLYGADMDETVTPLEAGLIWTVAFQPEERDFIGREALEAQRKAGGGRRFAGLVLEEPGIMRHGQRVVVPGPGEGIVTSGIFSPTLGRSLAFARLPAGRYDHCLVDIRGQLKQARVTSPRFLEPRAGSEFGRAATL